MARVMLCKALGYESGGTMSPMGKVCPEPHARSVFCENEDDVYYIDFTNSTDADGRPSGGDMIRVIRWSQQLTNPNRALILRRRGVRQCKDTLLRVEPGFFPL